MSILNHVPEGYSLRKVQEDMLLDIENVWSYHDIIVLRADVGVGKSLVLQTVAKWQASQDYKSAIITPRVALQDQYAKDFTKIPTLKGASRYKCKESGIETCAEMKLVDGYYCKGVCPYQKAREKALNASVAVYNLQSYLLSQNDRDIVLLDEAHTLFDQLSDMNSVRIWDNQYKIPKGVDIFEPLLVWLEQVKDDMSKKERSLGSKIKELQDCGMTKPELRKLLVQRDTLSNEREKLARVYDHVKHKHVGSLFLEEGLETYRGKEQKRLLVRPKNLEGLYNPFNKRSAKKVILATATIQDIDLKKLGFTKPNIKILEYGSPFDLADRPVIVDLVGNMGWKYRTKNMPVLAQRILDTREKHLDTKGIVHMPYAMAKQLREYITEPWLMFHDTQDKEKQLKFFTEKAEKGTVLIASGMSMGIDMAGPDFGWQAIAKILYPSQADNLIKHWYTTEPAWVTWMTARDLIQACGRVNRYAGDFAVTYIWDSCIGVPHKKRWGLWQAADKLGYFTEDFKRRFKWV